MSESPIDAEGVINWRALRALIKKDVFGKASTDEAALLRSDELIFLVASCAKGLLAATCKSIEAYRIQTPDTRAARDEKWFHHNVMLQTHLHKALPEYRHLAHNLWVQRYAGPSRASLIEALRRVEERCWNADAPMTGGFQILRIQGERADLLGVSIEEPAGARIVALLNRHGLEDVPIDHPGTVTTEERT